MRTLVVEGWGEGVFEAKKRHDSTNEIHLTLTLSCPGEGKARKYIKEYLIKF